MGTRRKTGNDYRKEYKELDERMKALDAYVRNRVLELVRIHPTAPISSDATGKHMNKKWLASLPTSTVIYIIQKIEKWSAEREISTQLTIDDKMNEFYNEVKDNFPKHRIN